MKCNTTGRWTGEVLKRNAEEYREILARLKIIENTFVAFGLGGRLAFLFQFLFHSWPLRCCFSYVSFVAVSFELFGPPGSGSRLNRRACTAHAFSPAGKLDEVPFIDCSDGKSDLGLIDARLNGAI